MHINRHKAVQQAVQATREREMDRQTQKRYENSREAVMALLKLPKTQHSRHGFV